MSNFAISVEIISNIEEKRRELIKSLAKSFIIIFFTAIICTVIIIGLFFLRVFTENVSGLSWNNDVNDLLIFSSITFILSFILLYFLLFRTTKKDIYREYNIFVKKYLGQLVKLITLEDIRRILGNSSIKSFEYSGLEEEIDKIIRKEFAESSNNNYSFIYYSDIIKIIKDNTDTIIYVVAFSKANHYRIYKRRLFTHEEIRFVKTNDYLALITENGKVPKDFYQRIFNQGIKTQILKKERDKYTIIYKKLNPHPKEGYENDCETHWIYFSLWKQFSLDYVKETLFKNLSEIKELIKTVCIE